MTTPAISRSRASWKRFTAVCGRRGVRSAWRSSPRFAAIPEVYWTRGNPYDPAIPPAFRGRADGFYIGDNRELCAFLDDLARAGLVEICLHGLTHSFFEFATHDRLSIGEMLDAALQILDDAIPAASINTFIAPYDRLSPTAMRELIARGFHIATQSWKNLAPLPELPQIAGHAAAKIAAGQSLFVCDDYLFTHRIDPAQSLARARQLLSRNDLTIISNHFWMFFHLWREEPNAADIAAWNALLDDILEGGAFECHDFLRMRERGYGEAETASTH